MDIKKQPKPWYIRYRYPILSGAAGIAILVYVLFLDRYFGHPKGGYG